MKKTKKLIASADDLISAAEYRDWKWLERLVRTGSLDAEQLRAININGIPLLMYTVVSDTFERQSTECVRALCQFGLASDIVRPSRFHPEQRSDKDTTPLESAKLYHLEVFQEFDEVMGDVLDQKLDKAVRGRSGEEFVLVMIRSGATLSSKLLRNCIRREFVEAVALLLAAGLRATRATIPDLNAIFDNRHGEMPGRHYYSDNAHRDWPRETAILLYAGGWDGKALAQYKPSNLRPRIEAARSYIARKRLSLVAPRAVDVSLALAGLRLPAAVMLVVLKSTCKLWSFVSHAQTLEKIVSVVESRVKKSSGER